MDQDHDNRRLGMTDPLLQSRTQADIVTAPLVAVQVDQVLTGFERLMCHMAALAGGWSLMDRTVADVSLDAAASAAPLRYGLT